MNSPAVPRRATALTPLALACAILFSGYAQAAQTLPEVVVTGSRFDSDPALQPIGATVISADEIRRAGVNDVNQAIRKLGGVYGRQSLDASPDFALDLRGFGTNSGQNIVIMVDGVRMSENDLGATVLSTIPVDIIEHITITRGGASVLFGEGATGGVIQIVTKRAGKNAARGSLSAELGQFNQRDLRASASRAWDNFAIDAAVNKQKTDNYRDNNAYNLDSANLGGQWTYAGGRIGARVERAVSESRLPGSLSLAQFQADPTQTKTPQNNAELEANRSSAFIEHRIGGLDLAAELSRRTKRVQSDYYDFGYSRTVYDSSSTQFSPRLRRLTRHDGLLNELVAGIDLTRWERNTVSSFSMADARQKSRAIYLRNEIKWNAPHNARLAIGARRESFDKDFADSAVGAVPEHSEQTENAWELQGSIDVAPLVNLYAKTGRSYRVPNADENGYRFPQAGVLKIQTSRDLEAGVTLGDSARRLTARAFRHQLTNEIFFDPTVQGWGANTNLDPTERKGVELALDASIAADWRASAHYQHVKARFTDGPNAGREMVLVPRNSLSARLSWVPANGHSVDLGVERVSSQRYGDDFTNSCTARVPSYHTVDARYARKLGAWEFAVSGLNLADKNYFNQAFSCRGGIYPNDGRQLKASVRYDF